MYQARSTQHHSTVAHVIYEINIRNWNSLKRWIVIHIVDLIHEPSRKYLVACTRLSKSLCWLVGWMWWTVYFIKTNTQGVNRRHIRLRGYIGHRKHRRPHTGHRHLLTRYVKLCYDIYKRSINEINDALALSVQPMMARFSPQISKMKIAMPP